MAYIDKINPNLLQGRMVVTPKGFVLKDPSAPRVKEPLQHRYRNLIDYIDTDLFPTGYVESIMAAYKFIESASAFGKVDAYNKILASNPSYQEALARWLAYDLYGLLPSAPKLCWSHYDTLNPHYRKLLDDALRAEYSVPHWPLSETSGKQDSRPCTPEQVRLLPKREDDAQGV